MFIFVQFAAVVYSYNNFVYAKFVLEIIVTNLIKKVNKYYLNLPSMNLENFLWY